MTQRPDKVTRINENLPRHIATHLRAENSMGILGDSWDNLAKTF